jgi:hypothetical protein
MPRDFYTAVDLQSPTKFPKDLDRSKDFCAVQGIENSSWQEK